MQPKIVIPEIADEIANACFVGKFLNLSLCDFEELKCKTVSLIKILFSPDSLVSAILTNLKATLVSFIFTPSMPNVHKHIPIVKLGKWSPIVPLVPVDEYNALLFSLTTSEIFQDEFHQWNTDS